MDEVKGIGRIGHSTGAGAGAGAGGIDGRVVGTVGRFLSLRAND